MASQSEAGVWASSLPKRSAESENYRIPLYWWRSSSNFVNFGDELSPFVVENMTGQRVTRVGQDRSKLLAVGSILERAKHGDIVWGTGTYSKLPSMEGVSFASVRGPLTRERVLSAGGDLPPIFGDPALYLPLFLPKPVSDRSPKNEILVAPHFSDRQSWFADLKRGARFIDVTTLPWRPIIRAIWASDVVITSTLHVGIVAESYGIPTVFVDLPGPESEFKFDDYTLSTRRTIRRASAKKTLLSLRDHVAPRPHIPDPEAGLNRLRNFLNGSRVQ